MGAVRFPTTAIGTTEFTAVALGKVYIGTIDLDPRVLANRIDVTITQEDGTEVVIAPAAQPFVLNAAGQFNYNGSVVMLETDERYSMVVDTADDVQVYYIPRSDPAVIDLGDTTVDVAELNVFGGAYAGYYTSKVLELEIVDGVLSIDWHGAQYFSYTSTEAHTVEFSNLPLIGEGIGQTIMLAIQDAGNFIINLDPSTGYTIYRRSIDDPWDLTVDGLDLLICTVYASGNVLVVPLRDFIPNT